MPRALVKLTFYFKLKGKLLNYYHDTRSSRSIIHRRFYNSLINHIVIMICFPQKKKLRKGEKNLNFQLLFRYL